MTMFTNCLRGMMLLLYLTVSCGQERLVFETSEGGTVDRNSSEFQQTYRASQIGIHSSQGWAKPVEIKAQSNVTFEVEKALFLAINIWNEAVGFDLLKYSGRSHAELEAQLFASLDDDLTMIYLAKNWGETTGKHPETIATTIWENAIESPGVIIKGDIILNAEAYEFVDQSQSEFLALNPLYEVDSLSVLLHELGHLIGLAHVNEQEDPWSVMHRTAIVGPGITYRQLSQGDVERVKNIYPVPFVDSQGNDN
jgi:hypothetical protein